MPISEKNPGARAIFLAIGMFAAGFLVVSAAVHAAIRHPLRLHADIRSEKLAVLDQMSGHASSAAFGSSHIHNGFNPAAFDHELAGSPLATRSENLGVAGGSQSEQRAMALEFVKHLRPSAEEDHACFVLLELNAGANFTNDHLVHPRAINIYDWQTVRFVSHLVDPSMSFKQRAGRRGYAFAAMALHYMNVGMLSSLVLAPPVNQAAFADETQDDRRGQRIEFSGAATLPLIATVIARQPRPMKLASAPITPGNSELIAQLAQASAVQGTSFAYIVMPKLSDLGLSELYPDQIYAAETQVPIIDLARPDRFPQLYRAELWHDDAHLNDRGAEIASGLIADELKLWYASHNIAPHCGS